MKFVFPTLGVGRFTKLGFPAPHLTASLMGKSPLPLPPAPPQVGFWAVLHESRSDYAQILTSPYLAIAGPGVLSLDARLQARKPGTPAAGAQRFGNLPRDESDSAPPARTGATVISTNCRPTARSGL